jgi:hypothetical protein
VSRPTPAPEPWGDFISARSLIQRGPVVADAPSGAPAPGGSAGSMAAFLAADLQARGSAPVARPGAAVLAALSAGPGWRRAR